MRVGMAQAGQPEMGLFVPLRHIFLVEFIGFEDDNLVRNDLKVVFTVVVGRPWGNDSGVEFVGTHIAYLIFGGAVFAVCVPSSIFRRSVHKYTLSFSPSFAFIVSVPFLLNSTGKNLYGVTNRFSIGVM